MRAGGAESLRWCGGCCFCSLALVALVVVVVVVAVVVVCLCVCCVSSKCNLKTRSRGAVEVGGTSSA